MGTRCALKAARPERVGAPAGLSSSRAFENDRLDLRRVGDIHRDVQVALHRIGERLMVDREINHLILQRLPDVGNRRVALGEIGFARERDDLRIDILVGIASGVPRAEAAARVCGT